MGQSDGFKEIEPSITNTAPSREPNFNMAVNRISDMNTESQSIQSLRTNEVSQVTKKPNLEKRGGSLAPLNVKFKDLMSKMNKNSEMFNDIVEASIIPKDKAK